MPLSCYSVLRDPSSFYTNLRSPLRLPSALDYFGLDVQAKDVIIADDDAGGVGKRIRSSACINALACAERAAEYIKTLLVRGLPESDRTSPYTISYKHTAASSYVFLLAENDFYYSGKWGEPVFTGTLSYIRKPHIDTVAYRIGDAECSGATRGARAEEVKLANETIFRSLSGVTGTTECARAMILSSVISLGGLEASWSKQHLVIKDAGPDEDLGLDHVRYTKADRWVLTVCVEHEAERAIKRLRS